MPRKCWLFSHLVCAVQLVALAVGQAVAGSVLLKYDNLTGSNGHACGATTVAAAVLVLLVATISALVWRLFQPPSASNASRQALPPTISRVEQSFFLDPRRWSLLAVFLALPLSLTAAIIDGIECAQPLQDLDQCTSTVFSDPFYEACSVASYEGTEDNAACACVSNGGSTGTNSIYGSSTGEYTCAYFTATLPSSLALGGDGVDCGTLPAALSTWLQVSTVLSGLAAMWIAVVAALGVLSAFSNRSCFDPITVTRSHAEPSRANWGASADDYSVEFSHVAEPAKRSSSKSSRRVSEAELLF